VLFENVRDGKFPLLCNAMGTLGRYALALGLPADHRALLERVTRAFQHPLPSVEVDRGVCQENVIPAADVDLWSFPTPRWHELDGGRYIGTMGVVIARDPDTGRGNAAIYREQIVDRDKTCVHLGRDASLILRQYQARGEPMPIATCFGVDPAVIAVAAMPLGYGDDELEMAGALAGEPVATVPAKTVDLLVPASAEFVFEGVISPDPEDWLREGPFGEFTGYYAGEERREPTIQLTAITHRDNPIMQGTLEDRAPNESDLLVAMARAMALKMHLIRCGIPGIKDVWSRGGDMIAVVSLHRQAYSGHARQVIEAAIATTRFKWFVVVDGDVDVFNWEEVEWALAMHVQPHRDVIVTDDRHRGSNVDPSIPPEVRPIPITRSSKIGIDATTEYKGFPWSTRIRPPRDVLRRVLEQWDAYGLGIGPHSSLADLR
jgi:4-hydroxy-3-polyprenylbenzoate decarboxylase